MAKMSMIKEILDRNQKITIQIFQKKVDDSILCQMFINGLLHENTIISETKGNLENIYVARVEKIMPSSNCAFVDIGDKTISFLPLIEKDSFQQMNPIPLKQGQKVLVQVKKEANLSKGAVLTRDIKIPGQNLMMMPYNNHITVSSRIQDKKQIKRLTEIGKKLSDSKFGIVFRTLAVEATLDQLKKEIETQRKLFEYMQKRYLNIKPPYCLYQHKVGVIDYISDVRKLHKTLHIQVKNEAVYNNIKGLQNNQMEFEYTPDIQETVLQVSHKNREKFTLPNKTNIVVDYCEALTVYDVNSSAAEYTDSAYSFLLINSYAAEEIFRQIKLKNISGIILIDFINMPNAEQYDELNILINELIKNDRIPVINHGFTKTGLLEITRKRTISGEL